jgi:hypothetical protein
LPSANATNGVLSGLESLAVRLSWPFGPALPDTTWAVISGLNPAASFAFASWGTVPFHFIRIAGPGRGLQSEGKRCSNPDRMSVRRDTFNLPARAWRAPAPWYGTAAGRAVAARGGFRDTGPTNREPTARPQVAAGIPALRGGGGCQLDQLHAGGVRVGAWCNQAPLENSVLGIPAETLWHQLRLRWSGRGRQATRKP